MKKVTITTDGACIGNPGPGGWACILRYEGQSREFYGSEPHTTNNRMEIRAAIEGLRRLREPCDVTLSTDSEYLKNGITEWLPRWKMNGWRKSKGSSGGRVVLNQDLWKELDALNQRHRVRWEWVRGHAKHKDNIRCDALANKAAREQISSDPSTAHVAAGLSRHAHGDHVAAGLSRHAHDDEELSGGVKPPLHSEE